MREMYSRRISSFLAELLPNELVHPFIGLGLVITHHSWDDEGHVDVLNRSEVELLAGWELESSVICWQ